MSTKDPSMAAAFLAAKKHLSSTDNDSYSKSEFICIALSYAERRGRITEDQVCAAKSVITQRLSGHGVFSSWLKTRYPELYEDVQHDLFNNNGKKMQDTRQAWLTSLIKEFS